MNRFRVIALMTLALSAGCFHITVISGAPASPKQIDTPWQHSFVFGIVPPVAISTKEACPMGIARYDVERSFLNGLVSTITQSIYTPIHTTITCASGPVAQ
jgi:Bor protein